MSKFGSRKFLLAVATVVATFVSALAGVDLDPEVLVGAAIVVASYIGGESYLDRAGITVDNAMTNQFVAMQAQALQAQMGQEASPGEGEPAGGRQLSIPTG